jgi:hypothetical protein
MLDHFDEVRGYLGKLQLIILLGQHSAEIHGQKLLAL